jgi:hypothetical protein
MVSSYRRVFVTALGWVACATGVAGAAQLRPAAVVDAPFNITRAEIAPAKGDVVVAIENTSDHTLRNVFVAGKVFSSGVRTGGWLAGRKLALEPGQTAEIRLAMDKAAVAGDGVVVLVPFAAQGGNAAGDAVSWTLKEAALERLALTDVERPLPATAGRVALGGPSPELAGACCDNCSHAAHSCGQNFLRGSCRTSACTSSYSCRASIHPGTGEEICECGYTCRDPDNCC